MGENSCDHGLVYLLQSEDTEENRKKGRCVRCSELVDMTRGYVEYPRLGYKIDGEYTPVYEKKALDQCYNILTKPGADIEKLRAFLEENYGNVLLDDKLKDILIIECTAEDGERLCAGHRNKKRDSPLNSIMVLSKRKKDK